jgi:MFS family permease
MSTSKKAAAALLIISFVIMFASMTSPLLAYIMQSYPEVDQSTAMRILTLPALVGLFVSFAVGPIATKFNKKLLLIVSIGCSLIYFVIFAVIGGSGPFYMLLAAAGIAGLSQGSALILTSSIIGEFIEAAKRATLIAVSGAVMSGGAALVNLTGGVIAAGNGGANWPYAYYLGVLIVPAMILFWIVMPDKPDAADPGTGGFGDPGAEAGRGGIPFKAILIILLSIVFFVCVMGFLLNISIYVITEYKLGTSAQSGLANSLFTMLGIAAGFAFALLVKVFRKWIVFAGYALCAIGLFLIMYIHTSLAGVYAGTSLMGFGFGMANPYLVSQLIGITPPRLVPITVSLQMGGSNLGMFFALDILNFLGKFVGGGLQGILKACVAGASICAVLSIFLFVFSRTAQPAAPAEPA